METNPISSNNVVEVGIPKPKCFTDCGNSLNDWLKWLAYDKCVTDWSTLDTSCLKEYLGNNDLVEQDLEVIVQLLLDATCELINSNQSNCCDSITVTLSLLNSWFSDFTTLATKKNGIVYIQGLVASGSGVITNLPLAFRPTRNRVVPVAAPSTSYPISILIETNGNLSVQTTGTPSTINLDLSFII